MNLMWVGPCYLINGNFVCSHTAIHPKMRLGTKDEFSAKIRVLLQTLQNPVSKHTALSIIINFEVFGQLNLVQV